ncbi:hypothetical protein TSTA_043540 [Talaromyces stipitatus ATCC 10500]|uniref:DDE-1 domain-containing protein n=1 Tax=Talaromyces stipitatus (strain ATCC 10500 / CBS 375.48 / QM 6759 / NRRL 1006) TaxID=441959 RepID=B8MK66_TALSN|nr:uncharacterized protein TSTA_043540 [Talaromyces stipitatus ATCC 10500]EED14883.1 hypothetical protein TSTA_043540 [Talaromyces stipitatus ATCC 10500]
MLDEIRRYFRAVRESDNGHQGVRSRWCVVIDEGALQSIIRHPEPQSGRKGDWVTVVDPNYRGGSSYNTRYYPGYFRLYLDDLWSLTRIGRALGLDDVCGRMKGPNDVPWFDSDMLTSYRPANRGKCKFFLLSEDWIGPGEPLKASDMWEVDHTAAEHYGEVERWFINLKIVLRDLKIRPRNLWNFDETGFVVEQGKNEAVVTAYPKTSERVFSLSSRESITVVECINAEGEKHTEEWYQHIKDEEWLVAPAKNGFITDEIVFEWLQHFNIIRILEIQAGGYYSWIIIQPISLSNSLITANKGTFNYSLFLHIQRIFYNRLMVSFFSNINTFMEEW